MEQTFDIHMMVTVDTDIAVGPTVVLETIKRRLEGEVIDIDDGESIIDDVEFATAAEVVE
jgi:hypothetical protein